ncbi:MAG: endolytic transglycosylase MltG [Alphaproteobacteria bacterium]|nr:endolytic transglycosylase MltG [Alphaproteobacteria bacterium]
MRSFFRFIFVVLLLGVAGAAAGGWYVLNQFDAAGPAAYEGETETIVSLPLGTGLNQAANILQERGVVRSALIFRAGVMYNRKATALKAGEYAIPSGASPAQIMDILIGGKSIVYKLTLAEGLTSAMILDLVRNHPSLTGDVTIAPSEGSLLPETYIFNRGMPRDDLVLRMQEDHKRTLNELWASRAPNLPIASQQEAVILASIVEKETGVAEERPRVAAVFVNRLRKGIKLQSDPTIIYGLTKGVPLGRGIRKSELEKPTPYNTYVIVGLPPTPIANPGKASLAAVLNPAQTEDLFFVADGTGGHVFAATLAQHEKNVQKWREIEKQRASATTPGTP